MNFTSCILDRKLTGKINLKQIRAEAAQYSDLDADSAMVRAVEDRLRMLKMEEKKIIKAVRAAYTAGGGEAPMKKPKPAAKKADVTDTPAFKRGFDGSVVVDADGNPLRMYHGTGGDITIFDRGGLGEHFTSDKSVASAFASDFDEGGNVMPVYLTIRNPLRINDFKGSHSDATGVAQSLINEGVLPANYVDDAFYKRLMTGDYAESNVAELTAIRKIIEAKGHDGIVYDNKVEGGGDAYIPFKPTQIKSATGNSGAFDPKNPSILGNVGNYSRDLIITHNLTEQNLLHADRMGGIAVPSLAVTKKNMPLSGFGEITLIGSKNLADPKGYAKTKVFGADIYSPRYPSIDYKFDAFAIKRLNNILSDALTALGRRQLYRDDIENAREFARNPAVRWLVLQDKGITIAPVMKDGKIDDWATGMAIDQAIRGAGAGDDADAKAKDILAQSGAEEKIFQGYSASGNRKYVDHTLANVVKILKKELRGGESFNYGMGSVRAKFTPQFNSIAEIQKAKGRLVGNDAFETVKKEIDQELLEMADAMAAHHPNRKSAMFLDTVTMTLSDAATMGIPRAIKENGFDDVPTAMQQDMATFMDKLRTLPTEYFEAIIARDVALSEFSGAVIPKNTSPKVRALLEKNGIPFTEYDNESSRSQAIDAFATELDNKASDILFNRQNKPPASAFDQSLYNAIESGTTARDLLTRIAKDSTSANNRALAAQLLRHGVASSIATGSATDSNFTVDRPQSDFVASYSPAQDMVSIFQDNGAETNLLHELTHAATVQAVAKGGPAAQQLQALYAAVQKSGKLDGMYGMENLDEFIAEAHSNPAFQDALKALPGTGPYPTMWDRFVEMVRNIIGLPVKSRDALSESLSIGRELMAENSGKATGPARGTIAQTATKAFKDWFGDSQAVDEKGNPKVYYHGTAADFDTFAKSKATDKDGRRQSMGWGKDKFYFADTGQAASSSAQYAQMTGRGKTQNVMPVYLSVQNPMQADAYMALVQAQQEQGKTRDQAIASVDKQAKAQGFDGIIDESVGGIAVFEPTQIKSSTGNSGAFDPANPSILGSARDSEFARLRQEAVAAKEAYNQFDKKVLAKEIPGDKLMNEYLRHSQAMTDTEKAIAQAMQALPDRSFAFSAKTSDGRMLTLNESAQKPGHYQLTRFDRNGAPWGDTQYPTKAQASRDFIDEADMATIRDFDKVLGNVGQGTFAAATDVLRDAAGQGSLTQSIRSVFSSDRKFNLWDRTIGTQFGKAMKDADFKRVFTALQQQVDDTAHYAIEAERNAPSILQRLDGLGDVFKGVFGSNAKYSKDLDAASKALFANIEGQQGVQQKVYSNAELVREFKLTPEQIIMYREVRKAVDTSIDRLAQSTIASMGEALGMNMDALKNKSLADTARMVSSNASEDVQQKVADIVAQSSSLQAAGYMPAMRFGQYAVTVTDKNGETAFFSMYESQFAAKVASLQAKKDFPGMAVESAVMNPDAFAMFKGVSPETVELFAKFSGQDQTQAYQDYIALAKSSRSSMKRLLARKGTAGFSQDTSRVLAQFITSNARQTALNVNGAEISDALAAVPKQKGDVQQEAQKLVTYLQNPQEEAQAIRGFMFMNFMGGSVASAMVNMTQPLLQTTPFLSQYAGKKIASIMASSAKMAVTGKIGDKKLAQAMERAKLDGITDPHEIHNLMADASGSTLGNSLRARALTKAWGSFFSLSEAYNRRLTFLAGYQTAMGMSKADLEKAGFSNEYDFAKNAIVETQGLYSKVNRPNWARGPVGATLFTFKQFSISYIEFLNRLPRQQKLLALGLLILAAGVQGLPFADDLEDLIDTIGESLGYATNSKKFIRQQAVELFGDTMGAILTNGLSTQAGIDLQGRLGMGNLLPGTAMFKKSEIDKGKSALEFAGPLGSVIGSFQKAISKAQGGDIIGKTGALAELAPVAVKNALAGLEMADTGYYKDSRGRKVIDTTPGDAIAKGLGFQPSQVATESRKIGDQLQDKNMRQVTSTGIAEKWANAIVERDPAGVNQAMAEMREWNANNPEAPINIKYATIKSRVQALQRSRLERTLKSLPKGMRAAAEADLTP